MWVFWSACVFILLLTRYNQSYFCRQQFELTNNLEQHEEGKGATNEHLDHNNPHTFEIEDLKKLIKKTTADLEAADKKRKEEFKVLIAISLIR